MTNLDAYMEAERAAAAAVDWLTSDYPRLAAQIADGLAKVEEADRLVQRVNTNLREGRPRLSSPLSFNHRSYVPDREVELEQEHWVTKDGEPTAIQVIDGQVAPNGARKATVKTKSIIAGNLGWRPEPLTSAVTLPTIVEGRPDFWPT